MSTRLQRLLAVSATVQASNHDDDDDDHQETAEVKLCSTKRDSNQVLSDKCSKLFQHNFI